MNAIRVINNGETRKIPKCNANLYNEEINKENKNYEEENVVHEEKEERLITKAMSKEMKKIF